MAIRTLKDTGSEYAISSDVDGSVYSLISSDCVIGGRGDEFTFNYTSSSLSGSFSKGSQALICGNAFWVSENESVTLPASSTFYLCARIDTSKPNGQTGSFECLTESSIKDGNINEGGIRDLKLYKIVTSSTGVSTIEDVRNIKSSSDFATKTYVDSAIESAIGDAINGSY